MSVMQGGSFEQAFWSGALGSLGASAFSAIAGNFANSAVGTIAFGALSGGIGAELSGGNFWEGAVIGGIVAGLNHAMHRGGVEPQKKTKQDTLDNKLKKIKMGTNVATSTEIIDAMDESLSPRDRRIFGKYGGKIAGFVAAGGEVYYNQIEYDNGKISGYRFTYRLGKIASSIVIGSSVAGPKGVALGTLVGVTFDMMEKAWDTVTPQIQQGYNNFINTAVANWMRHK